MIEIGKRSTLSGKLSSPSQFERQRILQAKGSAVLLMFFILLLVVAISVILFLPGYVDAINVIEKSENTSPHIIQPNPETPYNQLIAQVSQKSVESLRQQFFSLKSQFDEGDVVRWGKKEYRQALKFADQGEQLLHQDQSVKAGEAYKSAITVLEELAVSRKQRLQTAILSGEQALYSENSEAARRQFNLALSIEPGNKRAENGMDKLLLLEQITGKLKSGSKFEEKGQLTDALAAYRAAYAIDPGYARVGKLLTRIEQKISREKFRNAMSDGYLALEAKKHAKAKQSFNQAHAIKPGSAEVKDALELVEEDYNLIRIRQYKIQAEGFENNEQWQNAVTTYQAILDLDNALEFALQGKKRSQFYTRVNDDIDYFIQHPARLASDEPYDSAVSFLEKVQSITHKGVRLTTKITVLEELVKIARISVSITLESDGKTDIVVYQVGKLGRFSMRTLSLNPGQYTVVGSCPGYQDVRKELTVQANQPKAYLIRCEEVI